MSFDSTQVPKHVASILAALAEEAEDEADGVTPINYAPTIRQDHMFPIAQYIDHTLLRPDATEEQLDAFCDVARLHGFKACCVNGYWAKFVTERVSWAKIQTCVVVGFPLGAQETEVKALEAKFAASAGATEVDMVLNIGLVKSQSWALLYDDIHSVVLAASPKAVVKVILETALLTQEEKIAACYVAAEAGAGWVKTCTGFGGGGATVEDVRLMRRAVGYKKGQVKVKASGGVKNYEKCVEMLEAGAERVGTSSGETIVKERRRLEHIST